MLLLTAPIDLPPKRPSALPSAMAHGLNAASLVVRMNGAPPGAPVS